MKSKSLSEKLEKILGLESPPIAVKIIKSEDPMPKITESLEKLSKKAIIAVRDKKFTSSTVSRRMGIWEKLTYLRL